MSSKSRPPGVSTGGFLVFIFGSKGLNYSYTCVTKISVNSTRRKRGIKAPVKGKKRLQEEY